jgi:hypothetical protein
VVQNPIIPFKKVHNLENYCNICILQYFVEFIFLTNFITSDFLNLKSLQNWNFLLKSYVGVGKERGSFGVGLNSLA